MGFVAPSSEKVYEYLLRVDQPDRSLGDGFCFSIVLVNDDSDNCRVFLRDYFVDLCNRTGKRIRFVFFSNEGNRRGIPGLQSELRGHDRGFVGAVIKRLVGRVSLTSPEASVHSKEREEKKQELTPESLEPVHNPEATHRLLGMAKDAHSVVPGIGESMKFAKRLGLSDQVPCIVIITDIDQLHVDFMPIGGMAPEEIYRHVRAWSDQFYAENGETLTHWERIEERISTLSRNESLRLQDVRDWRTARQKEWETSQALAGFIGDLQSWQYAERSSWGALAGTWQESGEALPEPVLQACNKLAGFCRVLQAQEYWNTFATELRESLMCVDGFQDLLSVLPRNKTQFDVPGVSEFLMEWERARKEIQRLRGRAEWGPKGAYLRWRRQPRPPGRKRLRKLYALRLDSEALETLHSHMVAELRASKLIDLPEAVADRIIARLNDLETIPSAELAQQNEIETFRRILTDYWRVVRSAPDWIQENYPDVPVDELLPPPEPDSETALALSENSAVSRRAEKLDEAWRHQLTEELVLVDREALALSQQLQEALNRTASQYFVGTDAFADARAAWEHCRAQLLTVAQECYDKCWKSIKEHLSQLETCYDPRRQSAQSEAKPLLEALDQYEDTVAQLRYPHKSDPDVTAVKLDESVIDRVLGVTRPSRARAEARGMAACLKKARKTIAGISVEGAQTKSTEELERTRQELRRNTPDVLLSSAMREAIPIERLYEAIPEVRHISLEELIRDQMTNQMTNVGDVSLLTVLTDEEREAIYLRALGPEPDTRRNRWDNTTSVHEQVSLVLGVVGLANRPEPRGLSAMAKFLLDNSSDVSLLSDDEVRSLGSQFRVRLEEYIRQLVSLYAPLGFTPEERSRLNGHNFGPMSQKLGKILYRPDNGDPRWAEARDKLLALHETPSWFEREHFNNLINEISVCANVFPHSTWEAGRETTPVERRNDLRAMVGKAKQLVSLIDQWGIYPICLCFNRTVCHQGRLAFEFDSDPQTDGLISLRFSTLPPPIHGTCPDRWAISMYRQPLLMMPWHTSDDPFVVSLLWDEVGQ